MKHRPTIKKYHLTSKKFGWCKECGEYFIIKVRQGGQSQKFCSIKCRHANQAQRYSEYRAEWQRQRSGRYAPNKIQCLICGLWYVQVGSHTYARHGLKGREYRELMGLDVKKGTVPKWYRKMKGEQALENGTWKNLKVGKKFRYKKNDPRLKLYGRGRGYKPTSERNNL